VTTLGSALSELRDRPWRYLVLHWNWKSALYSSLCRGAIFFFVNLTAGADAATGAMLAEFTYRGLTAGFYGAITQMFRKVRPLWHGTLCALGMLMCISHSLEFLIHRLRHTPKLGASILASICFTVVSTLFNLYAMRRGVFVTDQEARTLASDLKSLPRVLLGFVTQS